MSKVNIPEKINLHYPEYASGDGNLSSDGVVQEIILQENKYKRELWRLQKILRRSMASDDPLPVFNRRHLLILVKRLCKDMEYSTVPMNKEMDITRLSQVLEISSQVSHSLLCISYCEALFEMRELLRRETARRNDSGICYCTELHGERALLPLHRLRYLKALFFLPQQHTDSFSTAIDGCFEVLASLHNQEYVSEVDNLLDFALIMGPPPVLNYENVEQQNDYNEVAQFKNYVEPKDEHIYEEIEMVPLKPANRRLSDIFFNNKKKNKMSFFPRNRFSISTTELCT